MELTRNKRIVFLSGPSGTGKGPIIAGTRKFFPQINIGVVEVYKSFESRPDRKLRKSDNPQYFLPAAEIISFKEDSNWIVWDCRGTPQAISLNHVLEATKNSSVVYVEVFHAAAEAMKKNREFMECHGLNPVSVFVSPLSQEDILILKESSGEKNEERALTDFLTQLIMDKQIQRSHHLNTPVSPDFISEALIRAQHGYEELKDGHNYDGVLVVPDGEGGPTWGLRTDGVTFSRHPVSHAWKAMCKLAAIFRGEKPQFDEVWPSDLIP
ncbi:hypothetical protein A2246_00350 [candidate division WOR-1 bacterium RIFOXYA2_FULL_37_7]|uniref:Guanylate kinase-like domain-containing protein n=1 Tax=candidate division WOR-1 bacterium RIFOXYB2_FULL_37_13 TaxID=1802579 RepID=A0A1F4SJQ6_UNCSA|nr:MAG: hypothetical protein A2246_00350 [candidate division WOR-1 bacterium RIFOXYA2_FULL_37_7]OGC19913.1 MAG: hypothetical protein A2310_08775 [candidate division WOR-1 bacterium RIFOXYB2_FULL_37_13]